MSLYSSMGPHIPKLGVKKVLRQIEGGKLLNAAYS